MRAGNQMRLRRLLLFCIAAVAVLFAAKVGAAEAEAHLYPVRNRGSWGYVNPYGEEVIPCQWVECGEFRGSGYALVRTHEGDYGIIRTDGSYAVYPIAQAADSENGTYYGGKDTGVDWLLDPTGTKLAFFDVESGFLSDYVFDVYTDRWFDGECSTLLRVSYDGKQYGYVDRQTGAEEIPCLFSGVNCTGFHNGFAYEYLTDTGEYVIVRTDGTFLSLQEGVHPIEGAMFEDGLIVVQDDQTGLYGYCNTEGLCVIEPQYEDALSFHEGYASVCQEGKWGHIDTSGKMDGPACFDEAYALVGGRALARLDGKTVLIDLQGKIHKTWEDDIWFVDGAFMPEGIALYQRNGYLGMIDREGKELFSPSQRLIFDFFDEYGACASEGMIPVMDERGKWGFANTDGDVIIDCAWDEVSGFRDGLAYGWAGRQMVLMDYSGKIVWREAI